MRINRSVRRRLVAGLVCIVLPLLGGWVVTSLLLHEMVQGFRDVSREAVAESSAVAELSARVRSAEAVLEDVLEGEEPRSAGDRLLREADEIARAFSLIEVDEREEERILAEAAESWATARAEALAALRGPTGPAVEPEGFYDAVDDTADALEEFDAFAFEELEEEIAREERLERLALLVAAGLLLVGLVVATVISVRLTRSIVQPLSDHGRDDEADELTVRSRLDREDELGELGRSFDAMAERLEASRDELRHQAFHDALTGLPNRALLLDRIDHAQARVARSNAPIGVLVVDLDEFKAVNDSMGHPAGDALLVEVSARLRSIVRAQDTAARLGGDEFAVVLEDLQEPAEAIAVAERVAEALREPYDVLGTELRVTGSVGVALGLGGEGAEELLRNADLAMYEAKGEGADRVRVYQPHMYTANLERRALERDLRAAVEGKEFFLQYQPLVRLSTGTVYGFEALVRWQHQLRGVVPPGSFVPLAEELGLIVPLGTWVLEEACREAAGWPDGEQGPLTLSVNLSARQLSEPDLVDTVATALAASGLAPERLTLEITESALAEDDAVRRLQELKRLGVALAVDDFGTGYSSLSRLHQLPVDVVKIDKSFVDALSTGEAAFVAAIVRLAGEVRVGTVAEGVEEAAQREALLDLGCRSAQGYLFARPLDAADVPGFVNRVPTVV
jgi:diguanylate cyclase (GGDEF)-like protein